MPAQLAQVCLFKRDGSALRRFCDVVSGSVEVDNGTLVSYHMGGATVAHHPPMGELKENDVLVTIQVSTPQEVDRMHRALVAARVGIEDQPENTDWGWRIFYFRAGPSLVFEVGAPLE